MPLFDSDFLKASELIIFNTEEYERKKIQESSGFYIHNYNDKTTWLNTYGTTFQSSFKTVIRHNNLDDFLIKLISDEHNNKVIELDNVLFVVFNVLLKDDDDFNTEQIFFILNTDFVWSIQEKVGDHFEWIRVRISANTGIVRTKKADYLFFLLIESIIQNYEGIYSKLSKLNETEFTDANIKPTPDFSVKVEARKKVMFKLKKATKELRDAIVKLDNVNLDNFESKFFNELKEQANNLLNDIDFEVQVLEGKVNHIFSLQSHRLNEVMKTLTIFSVIFIPLTFLAGIYGMNFKNIPELETEYGYFVLLGVMVITIIVCVLYFKKKDWF